MVKKQTKMKLETAQKEFELLLQVVDSWETLGRFLDGLELS